MKQRWKDSLIRPMTVPDGQELAAAAMFIADALRRCGGDDLLSPWGASEWRKARLRAAGWLIRAERKRLDPKGMTVRWDLYIPDDDTLKLWEALRCVAVAAQQDDSEPYNAAVSLRRAEACLREYWKATR